MLRVFCTLFCLALIATGCDETSSLYTYTESIPKKKPVVSIIPIVDNTRQQYTWSLSDELTALLYSHISQTDSFYLVDLSQAQQKRQFLQECHNPFGTDVSWVKKAFQGDEFVVFLELVEHEERIRKDWQRGTYPQSCAADLNMSIRIRVFDLRDKQPKVILQEILHKAHFIPPPIHASQLRANLVESGKLLPNTSWHCAL